MFREWRLWFLAILCAASANGQPLTIPRFDFSFSNPGARSLGFGGAFAALADDATAAYANPAGLVQLAEPEVSVEARLWRRSPLFLAGGRAEGEPTGRGIDTHPGLLLARDHSQELGPSFASVVIPKGRWSFALYGHQLAKFEEKTEFQGLFFEEPPFPFPLAIRSAGSRESVDLDVTTAGLAAGWRMNDHVSFGLGAVFSQSSLRTTSETFRPDDDSARQYERISFLPSRRLSTSTLRFDGTDVTVTAGVLGKVSEQLSAGLFFRQGAQVKGTFDLEVNPDLPFLLGSFRNEAVFQVPDVAGAGLAYRSHDGRVTFATEADHVGYSGLVRVLKSETVEVENIHYSDAWEYHAGAEYALLQRTPILAFRAGAWIEKNGQDIIDREVTHWSAGIGIAAPTFQIDLAGDLSDNGDTASLSFIYTF
jgi:long-subunit fatty acid transport protein